jgi:DNA-binding NarL/FixJ family response regulator
MTNALLTPSPDLNKSPTGDSEPSHRLVLVDSRQDRRAVMNFLVDTSPGLTVVGLAGNLDEAAALIRSEHADVALIEIQMPLADGLATISGLRHQFPELRILVCSFLHDSATREAATMRGADGYLAKPPRAIDLLALVRRPAPDSPEASDATPGPT